MECELLLVTVFNSPMQLAFLVFKNFLLPCDFIFRRLRQLGGNVTVT